MFSVVAVPVYIPTNSEGRCPLLHTLSSICYLWTFKMAILTGVRLYLIAVLIYIFLIISDVEHFFFSCACQASVYILWRNISLAFLPIFLLVVLAFLLLSCISCTFQKLIPCQQHRLKLFSAILQVGFIFMVSFAVQNLVSLIRSY